MTLTVICLKLKKKKMVKNSKWLMVTKATVHNGSLPYQFIAIVTDIDIKNFSSIFIRGVPTPLFKSITKEVHRIWISV